MAGLALQLPELHGRAEPRIIPAMARAVNSQAGRLSTRRGRGSVGDSESEVRIVLDPDGSRPNVGIVLMHHDGRVFWPRTVRRDGWPLHEGGRTNEETAHDEM